MRKFLILLPVFFIGCSSKPRYNIWAVHDGMANTTSIENLNEMKKNPLYWDCHLNTYGIPFCKECMDMKYSDFPNETVVDPKLCMPEKEHGGI